MGPAPRIDVTAYGARADSGATDNATPIQNAINACPTTGCTIYFPYAGTGNYYSGTKLTITSSKPFGIKLVGECSPDFNVPTSAVPSCSHLISDQAIIMLEVGDTGGGSSKYHGR